MYVYNAELRQRRISFPVITVDNNSISNNNNNNTIKHRYNKISNDLYNSLCATLSVINSECDNVWFVAY